MAPTIGRIVHYTLTEYDAASINKRRADANQSGVARQESGAQVHAGNGVSEGDVYPLVITRVWGPAAATAFNGQVLLDGNDALWITSTRIGDGPGKCTWPPRV